MNLDTNQAKSLPFTVAITGCLLPITYKHTHRNTKDSDTWYRSCFPLHSEQNLNIKSSAFLLLWAVWKDTRHLTCRFYVLPLYFLSIGAQHTINQTFIQKLCVAYYPYLTGENLRHREIMAYLLKRNLSTSSGPVCLNYSEDEGPRSHWKSLKRNKAYCKIVLFRKILKNLSWETALYIALKTIFDLKKS